MAYIGQIPLNEVVLGGAPSGLKTIPNAIIGSVLTSTGTGTNAPSWQEQGAKVSFTPGLAFGGASTGIVYNANVGTYVRFGSVVFFHLYIALTNKGSATGGATVTDLPITVVETSQIAFMTADGVSFPTGTTYLVFEPQNATTTGKIASSGTNTGSNLQLDDTNFANDSSFIIQGFYYT